MFAQSDLIYAYTRKQAIEDGEQILLEGDLGKLAAEHYKHPVYLTRAVWDVVERAVNNQKYCNDWECVIHDILWMSRRNLGVGGSHLFQVIIRGAGRKQIYQMVIECGVTDIDNPMPCLTIMFREDRLILAPNGTNRRFMVEDSETGKRHYFRYLLDALKASKQPNCFIWVPCAGGWKRRD
jgi:hypothetical protein